jgi:prepilin-type processing-associated H-X9-DG protein
VNNKPTPGEDPKWGMHRIKCANGYATGVCMTRHTGGGANVVFADDHARFIPGGQIVVGTSMPFEWPMIDPSKTPAE